MSAVGTTDWETHDDPEMQPRPELWYSADGHALLKAPGGGRIDLGPVEPVGPGHVRPVGALTVEGSRFLRCSDCSYGRFRSANGTPNPTRHTAKLGSCYWSCVHCGQTKESAVCKPEDFPFDPTPAAPETADLAVSDDVRPGVECSSCHQEPAVMTAYFAELGKTAQLLPWCSDCFNTHAGLVVAAGYPLTLLPLDPIPGYHELRAQLDRIQLGDGDQVDTHAEARAAVQRFGPAQTDPWGNRLRAPLGRKPGEWK